MKVAHLSEPAEERVVFRDGLGVREWRDTGTGERVEWCHLDQAFAAAEIPLRERVSRLAKLQHVRFTRIFGLEPARKGAGPVLVSSHVVGTRLIEALEMAGHGLLAFDPGAGLQVVREVLGALTVLHDSRNVTHGALAPERILLTPTGRVVMVEHVLAQALERLQLPRHQLWRDWRIATPPGPGQARFDIRTDLAQLGLLALATLLGRPIDEEEYPHRLRGLLIPAQDRLARSAAAPLAADVVAWVERLMPVESRRAFKSVRDAQQAFEALVSPKAAAMGIAPARVKTILTAVTALAPQAAAPSAASPVDRPLTVVASAAAPAWSEGAVADGADDIDIEALLRLEAELEGGPPAVATLPTHADTIAASPAVTAPPRTPALVLALPESVPTVLQAAPPADADAAAPGEPLPAPADTGPLDALAQERLDLQRQLAEIVAAVAPDPTVAASPDSGAARTEPAESPVRLIPETPETVEPLVDARVLWSSMPVDASPDAQPSDEAIAPDGEAPIDADALPAFAFEPIAIRPPDEPMPTAAMDHVPAEWWREALPWRDQPTEAPIGVPTATQLAVEAVEPVAVDPTSAGDLDVAQQAVTPFLLADATAAWPVEHGQTAPPSGVHDVTEQDSFDALATTPAAVSGAAFVMAGPAEEVAAETEMLVPGPFATTDVFATEMVADPALADSVLAPSCDEDANGEALVIAQDDIVEPEVDPLGQGAPAEALADVQPGAIVEGPPAGDSAPVDHTPASDFIVEDAVHTAAHDRRDETGDDTADGARVLTEDAPLALDERLAVIDVPPEAAPARLAADVSDLVSSADGVGSLEPIVTDEREPSAEGAGSINDGPIAMAAADPVRVAAAVAGEPIDASQDVEDVARPEASGWFVTDAQPAVRDDAAADAPLATGGFRAFAGLDSLESAAETRVDDGPAMRTAFVFPDVVEEPQAASFFGLDTTGTPEVGATTVQTADAGVDAVIVELDASAIDHTSLVPASQWLAEASVDDGDFATGEPAPVLEVEPDEKPAIGPAAVVEVPVELPAADAPLGALSVATLSGEEPASCEAGEAESTDASPLDADVAPAVQAGTTDEPAAAPAPAVEPDAPTAVEPAPATGTSEVLPGALPEIVIVDEGQDRNAWDHLPSELPVTDGASADPETAAADDTMEADLLAEEDAETDEGAAHGVATSAAVAGGSKKKRRRSRRRKGLPAIAEPVVVPARQPATVPSVLSVAAMAPAAIVSSAPGMIGRSAGADAGQDDAPPPRGRSLLEREVPTWTPSEHVEMRVRPLLPRAEVVAIEPAHLPSGDETDQALPARPSRDSVTPPASPSSAGSGATPPPFDTLPVFEPEIRAVGMPDLAEIQPKGRAASVTSMAEAIGSTGPVSRSGAVDRTSVSPQPVENRASNWRRFIAAAALIALFNGGAFAAWWWVQPGAYGTLVVQTAQSGVEVVLDGKAIGRTPFRDDVAPGRHTLTLRHNGQKREMPVEISLGVVTTQALEWPIPEGGARGGLQLTSTPTAAKVYVDGQLRGETPLLLDDLPAGKQELTLRGAAGTVTVAATVVAGETTSLEVPIFAGWVVVDAPVEMNLLLRGAKIGSTMDGQILLSPGRHQIEAVSETLGFRRLLSVTIEPGEVKRVAVTVPRATLQVQDEPGSEVYVDGDRVGTLPGALQVPLGTHDVLVRRPDGSERRQTVTVRAGDAATM